WWFRHALLDLGVNPLQTDFIFYPLGIDLVLYTYNIFNAAVALPLLDWLGPIVTSNLILIGMTVLSGWGVWLLVRWLLARTLGVQGRWVQVASWGAGALYAFGAYRAVYAALGHYDLVSTGFIPLFALFFLKSFWGAASDPRSANDDRGIVAYRPAVLAGIFMAAALANEMIFGVFLAMLALILMGFTWRRAVRGWVGRLAVAVLTAVVLWAPVGIPVVRTLLSTDFVLTGWGDALKLSADLFSFTSPTALHPLWGPEWVEELRNVQVNVVSPGASRFSDVNTVFVGISTLLLSLLAVLRFRHLVAAWAAGLVTFLLLALGPVLQVGGKYLWSFDGVLPGGQLTAIPLPFIVLHYLPIVQGNRAANRFSVVLLLCAAVLVGYGLWWVARAVGERTRRANMGTLMAAGLSGVLLVEQLALPLPLTDARIPEGYHVIAEDPDDVAVLTLPLGWRNSFGVTGAENTRNQYYMVAHGKRLLQGNISRAPAEKFEYWERLPVLRSLIEIQNDRAVSEEQKAEDAARALETMALLGVRYVVVHPGIEGRPPYVDNRERALQYLQEVLPMELLYTGEDLLVYRVDASAPRTGQLDFGTPESDIYHVAGWSEDEAEGDVTFNWAQGEATFLVPLAAQDKPLSVGLQVRPFQLPQTVQPLVNGRAVANPISLETGWNDVEFTVPASALDGPTARVTLRFSRTDRPVDVLPGIAMLGQTGVETRLPITVKSAGPGLSDLDPGGLAWITVAGEDASDHRLGTNVTVLDPVTGEIEAVSGFDTTANEFERERLHEFIKQIPEGKVVVVALKGPATAYLNLDTVAALKTLGAATGPTNHGVSYALIGVKGAPEGSALEAESGEGAVDLAHLPDDRPLSSAVRSLSWEQGEVD
ncbi:MAG: hypothetical protein M3220_12910, partial [Chloroflexota bacterium]|nr:hypothetical protein [Chloroflexota bacterium]